eukprot:136276_1
MSVTSIWELVASNINCPSNGIATLKFNGSPLYGPTSTSPHVNVPGAVGDRVVVGRGEGREVGADVVVGFWVGDVDGLGVGFSVGLEVGFEVGFCVSRCFGRFLCWIRCGGSRKRTRSGC